MSNKSESKPEEPADEPNPTTGDGPMRPPQKQTSSPLLGRRDSLRGGIAVPKDAAGVASDKPTGEAADGEWVNASTGRGKILVPKEEAMKHASGPPEPEQFPFPSEKKEAPKVVPPPAPPIGGT